MKKTGGEERRKKLKQELNKTNLKSMFRLTKKKKTKNNQEKKKKRNVSVISSLWLSPGSLW